MIVTDLDQQLAELQGAADAYAARHQFIEDLAWPKGVRIAVNFTCDFDAMLLRRLLDEPPMQLTKGEFGGRVGIWRLIELFDAHGVKATIFTPGRICELYPQALRAVVESGHEIADHMWEHWVPKEPALEEDHLAKTVAALERVAGRRPTGTRSSHSAKLLRQYGYIYRSEGSADQRPHYEFDEGGGNGLINLPMHYAIDDAMYFNFNWLGSDPSAQRITDPERVCDIWWAAFRQQYNVGGYLNVCMHPFQSGRALRVVMLDRLIARMKSLPGVWFPTCEQVARHCSTAIRPARARSEQESATMPWKQGYTISDERSLADSEVRWPNGARCCIVVTVDLSVASGPEGVTAADLATPEALFGANQGLAALREVLSRHAMRATFAVPAIIAHIHRDLVRSLAAEGHEIAANGFRHEDVSGLDRDEEQRRMARTTEILADTVGHKPTGWFSLPRQGDHYAVGALSPNTIDLLLEAGYVYLGNGLADDVPYYSVSDFASRRALLTLPYYYHFDDQFFLMFPRRGTGLEHPDALLRNWRGEFAAQYKRGRYFHMTLHPQHIGWSNRLQLLDEFLAELRTYPGLWNPTATECARYWLETYPARTHLRLEPSVWQDYPGSLS